MRSNLQPEIVSTFSSASDAQSPSSPARRTSFPAVRSPS